MPPPVSMRAAASWLRVAVGRLGVALCSPVAVTDRRFMSVICACGSTEGSGIPIVFSVELLAPTLLLAVPFVAPTGLGEVSPRFTMGAITSGAVGAAEVAVPPLMTAPLLFGTSGALSL